MFFYLFDFEKYGDRFLDDKINIIEMENTYRVEPHTHTFLEYVYVVSGSAEHYIDDRRCDLKAGDYFVVNLGSVHSYTETKNFTIINCMFSPKLFDLSDQEHKSFDEIADSFLFRTSRMRVAGQISNRIYNDDDGSVGVLFREMVREYSRHEAGCVEMLRNLVSSVIIKTIRQVGSIARISEPIRFIISEIDHHYSEHISLGKLCAQIHRSLPYVSERFKEETGISFSEYLKKKRIAESCLLLTETDDSILEISEQVGYNNIKFFNKVFKEITGTTPREYRKRERRYSR